MNARPCTSCGAPIVDLPTSKGKLMPLNRSFFVERMTDEEFHAAKAPLYEHVVHQPFVHWSTCPSADRHRKGKS